MYLRAYFSEKMAIKTKISAQDAVAVRRMLDQCKNVVVVTHYSPDGDAIGSALAMWEYLKKKGKQATVIVPNFFPDFLKWMNGADQIVLFEKQKALSYNLLNMADLVVVLDLCEASRMGEELGRVVKGLRRAKKIVFDHHLNPDKKLADLLLSFPDCSSTCELLFRVFIAIDQVSQLSRAAAEDIYAGMYTDTGGFSYNSNDPDVFNIIAELLRKGIDKDRIVRNINNNFTAERFRLMGYVLYQKLLVLPEYHASIYSLTADELRTFKYLKGDMEGVVNMPLQIRGQKVSISLREDLEHPIIWVSIRSYDDVSARDMAEQFFNGGGHFNAAGGKLENCTMDEAIAKAKTAIEAFSDVLADPQSQDAPVDKMVENTNK